MYIQNLFHIAAQYYTKTPDIEPSGYENIVSETPNFVNNRLMGFTNFGDMIVAFINWVLFFLFIITILFIIIGGFKWIFAGGNEDQIGKAKKTVIYAIVGLFIVISSYSIVATLTGNYFYIPYLSPPRLTDSPFDQPGMFFNP